jgi:hypothetical protein
MQVVGMLIRKPRVMLVSATAIGHASINACSLYESEDAICSVLAFCWIDLSWVHPWRRSVVSTQGQQSVKDHHLHIAPYTKMGDDDIVIQSHFLSSICTKYSIVPISFVHLSSGMFDV